MSINLGTRKVGRAVPPRPTITPAKTFPFATPPERVNRRHERQPPETPVPHHAANPNQALVRVQGEAYPL